MELGWELAIGLSMIAELLGTQTSAATIDVLRGSKTKRANHISRTATINRLSGKGSDHDFTWWFEFFHGVCRQYEFITYHPERPNCLIITEKGKQAIMNVRIRDESKASDSWPTFRSHISLGMQPRVSVASQPEPSLSKDMRDVFDTMCDELDRVAKSYGSIRVYTIPNDELKRILLTVPPMSVAALLADAAFVESGFFKRYPQVQPSALKHNTKYPSLFRKRFMLPICWPTSCLMPNPSLVRSSAPRRVCV
jgi:hypothetical protein